MQSIQILEQLINAPTITPKECGLYDYIQSLLPDFEVLKTSKAGTKNLFLYKQYGEGGKHFCFGGHIDVVPPGEGWSSDPFCAIQKDGFLYGRGAQDMKSGVAACIGALQKFSHQPRANFNGMHSLLLTSNEEGDGLYGTEYMLQTLKAKNLLPNIAIVAEPTCEHAFGDMIKIGRRGSIHGRLVIEGIQGHVAYPKQCCNPTEMLALVFDKIAGFLLDEGDEYFEPSKIVITQMQAGMGVCNVTPKDLTLVFNIRNGPKTSLQSIQEHFESLLEHIPHKLSLNQSSKPFLTHADFIEHLSTLIQKHTTNKPILSTNGGTSDARFFAQYGIKVAEFGVCNDKIHAINERVRIEEVEQLEQVFYALLEEQASF